MQENEDERREEDQKETGLKMGFLSFQEYLTIHVVLLLHKLLLLCTSAGCFYSFGYSFSFVYHTFFHPRSFHGNSSRA